VEEGTLGFLTGPLPQGHQVFRYGLLLTADGRFGLPGTWVQSLGDDSEEGRGDAIELRVEP
jgi:hypothetical protein